MSEYTRYIINVDIYMCTTYTFMFNNNALLGGGVRVRVWIRE